LAAVSIVILAVAGTILYLHSDAVATAIGEQRTLSLEDGTAVYLKYRLARSRAYDKTARRVDLDRGRHSLKYAKRPGWPFIVTAASADSGAGDGVLVRRDEDR